MTPEEAAARYDELKDTIIALLSDELTEAERMAYIEMRVKELKAAIAKSEFMNLTGGSHDH